MTKCCGIWKDMLTLVSLVTGCAAISGKQKKVQRQLSKVTDFALAFCPFLYVSQSEAMRGVCTTLKYFFIPRTVAPERLMPLFEYEIKKKKRTLACILAKIIMWILIPCCCENFQFHIWKHICNISMSHFYVKMDRSGSLETKQLPTSRLWRR